MAHAKPLLAVLTLTAVAATIAVVASQAPQSRTEWRYYGGNKGFTRYSALDQINRDNVKNLRIAWRRPAINDKLIAAFPETRPNAYLRATPIMIDGVLYTQDAHGLVIALDGETGRTIWEQPFGPAREDASGASTRGVDYWRGGTQRGPANLRDSRRVSLRARCGNRRAGRRRSELRAASCLRFADRQPLAGRFNDSTGPLVLGNVVVVTGNTGGAGDGGNRKEAAPEDVRGFDAETGRLLWTFHVVPQPGEFGNDTWGNDSWKIAGDLGAWNPMTADEELGYVYVPLTSPTAAWYGGWRPGDNLFANSLVALDVKTGKRVWHFQTVHHDLWDWDNIGPPMLGEITVDGKRINAVMQANKAAFLYVLDRTNGRPVWPIEERPVPQSTVPGEHSSPTQPFPTKPPPFDLQGISDNDLIDYTPALKQRARTIANQYVMGPVFSPPSVPSDQTGGKKGTLVQPGAWGSANWNTGAFDPDTGYYYAISQTLGPANRAARKQTGIRAPRWSTPTSCRPLDRPINRRPSRRRRPSTPSASTACRSSRVPTVESRRSISIAASMSGCGANGDGPRFHPLLKDLNLPPLGYPNRPAPLLTKTLAVSRRRQRRHQRNRRRRLDVGNEVPRL